MAPIVFWFGNLCFPRSVLSGTTVDFTPYTSEPTKKYFFTCIITRKKQGSGRKLELCLFTDARHEIPPYILFFLFLCVVTVYLCSLSNRNHSLPFKIIRSSLQSAVLVKDGRTQAIKRNVQNLFTVHCPSNFFPFSHTDTHACTHAHVCDPSIHFLLWPYQIACYRSRVYLTGRLWWSYLVVLWERPWPPCPPRLMLARRDLS